MIKTDLPIIGAGPTGLFTVFEEKIPLDWASFLVDGFRSNFNSVENYEIVIWKAE